MQRAPLQCLTKVELQDHRDRGIRYECNENFFLGHWCKNKQLQLLLAEEDDVVKGDEADEWVHDQLMLLEVVELSLNSTVGISITWTMKYCGIVIR